MKNERMFFVQQLMAAFPNLHDSIQDNLADFPEVYLHLIFGDIFVPYLIELLDAPVPSIESLFRVGDLVETMATADEYVQEVVVTTILEPLSDNPKHISRFEKIAGPQTRAFIKQMRSL